MESQPERVWRNVPWRNTVNTVAYTRTIPLILSYSVTILLVIVANSRYLWFNIRVLQDQLARSKISNIFVNYLSSIATEMIRFRSFSDMRHLIFTMAVQTNAIHWHIHSYTIRFFQYSWTLRLIWNQLNLNKSLIKYHFFLIFKCIILFCFITIQAYFFRTILLTMRQFIEFPKNKFSFLLPFSILRVTFFFVTFPYLKGTSLFDSAPIRQYERMYKESNNFLG